MYPAPAMPDPTPARVSRTGNALRKPAGGPPALTKRHHAFIRFMVHGIDCAFPRWPDVKPHTPLSRSLAADIAGLRQKNARDLFNWPIFVTAYERECAALRKNEHARSIHTMIEVRDDRGAGKAADRKVRMQAAQALIGEHDTRSPGVTVNINQPQQAGIFIRVRGEPLAPAASPRTIQHEDA